MHAKLALAPFAAAVAAAAVQSLAGPGHDLAATSGGSRIQASDVEFILTEEADAPRRQPLTLRPVAGARRARTVEVEPGASVVFEDVPFGSYAWSLGYEGARAAGTVTVTDDRAASVEIAEIRHFDDLEVRVDVSGIPEAARELVSVMVKPRGSYSGGLRDSIDIAPAPDGRHLIATVRDAAPTDWACYAVCRGDDLDIGVQPRVVLACDGVAQGVLRLFEMPPRRRVSVQVTDADRGSARWIDGADWLDPNPTRGRVRFDQGVQSFELDLPMTGETTVLVSVQQASPARIEFDPSESADSLEVSVDPNRYQFPLRTLDLSGAPIQGLEVQLDGEALGRTDERGFIEVPIAPTREWDTLVVEPDDPGAIPFWAGRKQFTLDQLPLSRHGVLLTFER